jgi:hypothetical protein
VSAGWRSDLNPQPPQPKSHRDLTANSKSPVQLSYNSLLRPAAAEALSYPVARPGPNPARYDSPRAERKPESTGPFLQQDVVTVALLSHAHLRFGVPRFFDFGPRHHPTDAGRHIFLLTIEP